ncbi:AAA family ATPase [Croceibacter atlanticus]|jgi:AAA15 family ATPase/GTPase|uniref:Abortive infection protein, putative n=1 Tax=Croceibacter atlanticus (strain ATCC BAA-628 / JCM 21780 / CIP 108009 / IAM 15332 / KCTC 12090 / HTCC2559) TaxID=216432 RepID=A3UA50_CROAH|nr:ATP-binding protein [Croceibacter atlanticus]EAP86686.1 abortive infection protein, putative [Croceibacter atlanticus HTCC2559]
MLIQFSVTNYKSFRDKATLSLVASNYDKKVREADNVAAFEDFSFRLLKSAVMYGPNASGKSKFFEAFNFVRHYVRDSATDFTAGDKIPVEPFLLDETSNNEPSEFEVIFLHNGLRYRYGFELTEEKVLSEWLYEKATKEIELFYRDEQFITTHPKKFKKGGVIAKQGFVRDNQLFLSRAVQFNDEISESLYSSLSKLRTLSGLDEKGFQGYTMSLLDKADYKQKILKLLEAADLDIEDIEVEKLDTNNLPTDLPKSLKEFIKKESLDNEKVFVSDVLTKRWKYNNKEEKVGHTHFSMDDMESSGTKKFFALTGPIIDTLENGNTLFVDELDSKLHPNLVEKIVSLFNSKSLNPHNAQLIFNTHNTNLLDSGLLRRDQIWFVEKDSCGSSELHSLSDFKKIRKNEALESNYLRGKYGAIPYLEFFNSFTSKFLEYENEG